MFRRRWRLAAVSLFALLLTACQVSITPPITFPPTVDGSVTAQDTTSPSPRLSDVTIQPGATLYYRVAVPVGRDLLYGEVTDATGLRVRWRTTSGTTLAVSESPTYFAGSVSELAIAADVAAGAVVEPLIIVGFTCDGPCVAIAPTASTYYLSVHNTTNSTQTFNLFAYTFAANDLNDRGAAGNQTRATATPVSIGAEFGAIELVRDRDWYRYTGPSGYVLDFSANNPALGLRLTIENGPTLTPGSRGVPLLVGDHFQVFSAQGRAGPSSTSGYTFEIRNP